ncbi:hypothetical protein BH10PAT3_BH10PAT3_5030 [soil metagenome]
MKNKWVIIPIVFFAIMFFLIVIVRMSRSATAPSVTIKENTEKAPYNSKGPETLAQKIYFQEPELREGIPSKTVTPKDHMNLRLHWVRESVADGQDTCNLYDFSTMQIYVNRYRGNGQIGPTDSGTTYYSNDAIKKSAAISLLDSLCFK